MKTLKIVVPCYNEEACIKALFDEVEEVFWENPEYDFSILFVDDGSSDGTLCKIKQLETQKGEEKVQYISLSRNFGKEAAMLAGLKHVGNVDFVALMDADLQHPPAMLPQMLREIETGGFDCCGARRRDRKGELPVRSAMSDLFYRFMNRISGINLVRGGSDFRVMRIAVVNAIISCPETERFTKGIMSWVGFSVKWLEYENVKRYAGKTKWSFLSLARYAVNGFVAFTTTPLRAAVYLGSIIVIVSFIYMAMILYNAIRKSDMERTGFLTIITLILFLSGVIITILGIIGEYLARIYMEVKRRPMFIIRETNIVEKNGGRHESDFSL